ncbi:hypothetical protein FEM48_Zijuj09G0101100 [Ziziphus jujuba var. spinosa]|uniref:BZIP domain-containing protein n=1 Tax=Ziziphus jujuba var. spinosa TaxID=714518 RepID=A0A978USD4_ZIZJJ|nr:hypothetical protein FEM48_Zijuj09G0101100 [Ziziphus jujuba var. spinosa]
MASSSGTSSGSSSMIQNSGSEEDLQALMDQRKRKRMISNRESARRSRMRKQKHLDDLTAQVAKLTKDNNEIKTNIDITAKHFLTIESENSILRAQVGELSHRLQSLDEIIRFLNANNYNDVFGSAGGADYSTTSSGTSSFNEPIVDSFFNPLNLSYLNQPIVASAELFQC